MTQESNPGDGAPEAQAGASFASSYVRSRPAIRRLAMRIPMSPSTTRYATSSSAHGDVDRAERRREHRVVDLAVAELPEDVGRRVIDGAVHRSGGEQRRRDVALVRDALEVPDERAEPHAEGEEVEERLEEAGEDR